MKKALKISVLILAFIMLASFTDVPKDHWANPYVSNAADVGLMIGDGDGNFRPMDKISKEEVAIVIYRILNYGTDKMTPAARAFTEEENALLDRCQISDWARLYLIDGFASGFWNEADFTERTDALTAGRQPLPRQKVAEWIIKAEGISLSPLGILPFSDASSINAAQFPYVDACYRTGLMIGDDENEFKPINGVNRAEIAVILTRALKLKADTSEAAAKAEVCGTLSAASGNIFQINAAGSKRTAYINSSATILVDGVKKDLAAVTALKGRSITLAALTDSNVVLVQTQPKVLTGTVEKVEARSGYEIVTIKLGDVSVSFIKNSNTNCGKTLAAGTSIKFISDGSNLLEIN